MLHWTCDRMSRFNNPKALQMLRAAPTPEATIAHIPPVAPAAGVRVPVVYTRGAQPNTVQRWCFAVLCAYLLSSFANEFAFRLFHGKAYISTVTVALMPILLLATGSLLRGFDVSVGKWWLAFGVWLAICAPFSFWKHGTAEELLNYYFRDYILYFVICASVLTLRNLTTLMFVQQAGAFLVVVSCMAFGSMEDGRLSVSKSVFSFLANANELGLQLLLGIVFLMFSFFRKGMLAKAISFGTILLASRYMFKTGSRGVFLASVVTVMISLFLSRNKLRVALVVLPIFAVMVLLLPSETFHRLTYIATHSENIRVATGEDATALSSQMQRERLFLHSVKLTLQHPLFGVGPGQFTAAASDEQGKKGELADWRGTHNSYTQVSSETGFPGLIFYSAVIAICLRMNYRVYRQVVGRKGLEDYVGLSYCLFLSTVVYAISTFFFHIAYSAYLPVLVGMSVATHFAARPVLESLAGRETVGAAIR